MDPQPAPPPAPVWNRSPRYADVLVVSLTLVTVALLAAVRPAVRAAAIDPAEALRTD